jgi:hypothetical protein
VPLPALSVAVVVERTQAAVQQAGTYRYELSVTGEPESTKSADNPWGTLTWGDVDIDQGIRRQSPDGAEIAYYDNHQVYYRGPDGTWVVYLPGRGYDEPLLSFLLEPADLWRLRGTGVVDGRAAYIIERTPPIVTQETYWIDAATFLPRKRTTQGVGTANPVETETVYFDFGAPVDVAVPSEASA